MSSVITVEQTDPFADEELETLLEWLGLGEGEEWQMAARSLYIRYYEWLFRRLYKPLKETGYLEDVVLKTFDKVFHNIEKFRKIEQEDPEDTRARFEAWLLKIGRRLAYDELRELGPTDNRDDEFWEDVATDEAEPTADSPSNQQVDAVREVLKQFPERDQIILRAWLQHSPDFTNPQSKLPRDVLQELAECLNTTKPNIRTIKSRAIARFRAELEQRGIKI